MRWVGCMGCAGRGRWGHRQEIEVLKRHHENRMARSGIRIGCWPFPCQGPAQALGVSTDDMSGVVQSGRGPTAPIVCENQFPVYGDSANRLSANRTAVQKNLRD
jgi:hypothetical protein